MAARYTRNWDSFVGIYDPGDQQSNICSLWLSLNELTHTISAGSFLRLGFIPNKKERKKKERERKLARRGHV